MSFEVDVVQYLRPDGHQNSCVTELTDELLPLYQAMQKSGCRFEAEVLRTGEVSITISNRSRDVDISVVQNGPNVQPQMETMLKRRRWEES